MLQGTGAKLCLLLAVCVCVIQVQGWGGWNRITSEVNRVADNVGREVQNAAATVSREAQRIGAQVETVYHESVQEVKKVPTEVEGWFVPSNPGAPEEPELPLEPGVTRIRKRGCRPLINDTVTFTCFIGDQPSNCAYAQAVGTVASIACKPGYKVTDYPGFTEITCTPEFTWSKQYFTCVPDCGKRNVKLDVRSTSPSGQLPELPWNVGVFFHDNNQQICSGSLITPTLALSAASCFWNPDTNTKMNASAFRLLAGNQQRDWSSTGAWFQRRDVSDVILHERFAGRVRLMANNVAVVRVTAPFVVTRGVTTVCLDWLNSPEESIVENGENGLVASWPTDAGIPRDFNSAFSLSYVTFDACADSIDEDFAEYLSHDKLCASVATPDVTVCSVDTGVGISFPLQTLKGTRFYLRGISSGPFNMTSLQSTCMTQKRALFTQFAAHLKWARPIVFETVE